MALVECPDCRNSVSDKAAYCPQCGHPIAPPPPIILKDDRRSGKKAGGGCAVVLVLFVAFVGAIIVLGSKEEEKEKANPTCKSNWRLCSDNADLINHFTDISRGQVGCEIEAKKLAKYGDPKFPSFYFSTFHRGNEYIKTGIVTLIEPDAQFQNAFGAMVHSTVTCTYDLNSDRVLNVTINAN